MVCDFCGFKVKTQQGLLRHINSNTTFQEAQRQQTEEEERDLDRSPKGKVQRDQGGGNSKAKKCHPTRKVEEGETHGQHLVADGRPKIE